MLADDKMVMAYPMVLAVSMGVAYFKFGKWPFPQFLMLLALVLVWFSGWITEGKVTKESFLVMFSTLVGLSVAFGASLQYNWLTPYGEFMPAFIVFMVLFNALEIESMFYSIGKDTGNVCNKYSIFGLGKDVDWIGYTRAVVDKNKDGQLKHMTELVKKYHPTNCHGDCKLQCTFTFDKIQEYSKDLVDEYY